MSELQATIEQHYEQAKLGKWDSLLAEWRKAPVLLRRCSRYRKPSSSWTVLHQAAYHGNAEGCRMLIAAGASLDALTHDKRSAAEVAAERGHHEIAALLRNASEGLGDLWPAPVDPDVLPGSGQWANAQRATATTHMLVSYAGSIVSIPMGETYHVDSFGRALIGWHGTYNPPCGMDGQSMVDAA